MNGFEAKMVDGQSLALAMLKMFSWEYLQRQGVVVKMPELGSKEEKVCAVVEEE